MKLHYTKLLAFIFSVLFLGKIGNAQILHDNSCSSISTNYSLDWDASPNSTQFNWTPQGGTTFTASNIQGSGNSISFSVTGATGSLTTENSISTPGVTNSLSGGADALHISSSGLNAGEEIELTMTFTPALAGNISFDLYNIIELAGGGFGGQQLEVFGLTSTGFAIVPELTDNGSPSWELEGPGVVDGNATSTAGTNDQLGVNFKSISDISTIHVILRRCSGCGNAANTEFALGDIDVCLTPDTDQDGIADTQDDDDDNDGIYDVIEKCPASTPVTADWDNYTYNNGDASNTYNLPDGTNMTVSVSSNGASIVAGETNSNLTGGNGAGTVGLFLNGNQNLQVNSIDVSFSWDQAISDLSYTIFDVDQLGGQYVDSLTIIGFYDGFVVFPAMTASANNTVTQNRVIGDASTSDDLATANVDVAFSEPIDSMVIFYGNGSSAPAAPGNQWITIWDFTYIGDCGSVDSDNDGVPDYLDIDADNDGIVDYIEWQGSTASPIAPAGTDADNDGIDDNFEVVSSPVDTDGDGVPDFQDPDSDNDGDLDILEGWDTDNDGIANTLPQSTDPDGDGLDGLADGSGFDDQNGFNSTTNITNLGQTSSFFPNLDNNLTAERDWREDNDFDGDGIQNYDDIDDDNDGILDVNEGRGVNNPNGDEDGDGIQNWSDTDDNGNGGDGSTTDYTDTNSDGIPDVYDVDFDGQPNHLDLDADGDGVADIIEAGGVDSDGNGIVDGVFTDTDGDGWSNTFDSDNGGTALPDVDQDADAIQNHLDIDADGDGIPDIIESQPSGALISPSGTDSDNDGIDNNFDTDNGNTLTDPVNTDAVDNDDYLDSNSDNDVDSDLIEGWDTNNNGTANTNPAGTDSDNDGLDDNFDNYDMLALQNYASNATDNGKTSASFPDLDVVGGELDWRDVNNTNDNDGDGILNAIDIDDDNDGVLDINELNCPSAATINSVSTGLSIDVGTTALLIDGSSGNQDFYFSNNQGYPGTNTEIFGIVLSQSAVVTEIRVLLEEDITPSGSFMENGVQYIIQGLNGAVWEDLTETLTSDGLFSGSGEVFDLSGNADSYTNYRILWVGGGQIGWDPYIDEVEVSSCSTRDTDNDGVNDSDDPDSDGDGIADIIEAGGVDSDGNGVVDGTFTDTDGDGWSNTFDSDNGGTALTDSDTDGDGFENRIDIDSDNDGIIDIVESQPSGILISPTGNDDDNDGIDNAFDTNSGNSLTTPENTDGADNPDYTDTDSDNDGDLDALEGYDTDNNGVANTTPAGTDGDNDGLDDNYDNVVGPNSTTNVTNGGQSSATFTDLDRPATPELDWREDKDNDNDGVVDGDDVDDDNDGVLDGDEVSCAVVEAYWTLDNTTDDASGNGNNERAEGNAPSFSTEAIQGTHSASFNGTSNGIRYSQDGGFMEQTYTQVSFSAWIKPTNLTGDRVIYEEGGGTNGLTLWLDDGTPTFSARSGGAGSQTDLASSTTLTVDNQWHHIAVTFNNGVMVIYVDGISNTVTAAFSSIPGHSNDGGIGAEIDGSTSGNISGFYAGLMDAVKYSNTIAWSASDIDYNCDTDQDGVPNYYDPDADGDGIADIIEAGGVDSDGNGVVDGAFSDTDGDGWSNTFDDDNGGTPLSDADTDGDGFEDRIDIDADDDGIIDIIESQPSGALIAPSGSDSDGDGIDDSFDPDSGNTLTTPTNTDGTDNPDYTDLNSDNDSQLDLVEGWDTDNDGVADTAPSGSDSDNDGLDDNFDNIVGPNNTTNVTNSGQSSASFPNLDNGNTDERDWREIQDTDGDGIADEYDIDDDDDGILDRVECNSSETVISGGDGGSTTNFNLNAATSVYFDFALIDNSVEISVNGTNLNANNELDLEGTSGAGSVQLVFASDNGAISAPWVANSNGLPRLRLFIDETGTVSAFGSRTTGSTIMELLTTDDGSSFNSITWVGGSNTFTVINTDGSGPDEISGNAYVFADCDQDGDGIDNNIDLDSDDDGIADIIEAGGVDANGDGRVDSNTDTNNDGWANTFDVNNGGAELPVSDSDGDGLRDYLDLDSDSDGLLDNLEAMTTPGYRAPENADIDGDGWDDEYDGDVTNGSNGTPIVFSNNEGVGQPDYLDDDSDGDGFPDWLEGFDEDADGDALADLELRATNYEASAGNPSHYVNSDDTDSDGIPNWLEDDDSDNIPNFLDPDNALFRDDDGDGMVNLYDSDNNGVSSVTPDLDGDGEYDFRDLDNQVSLPIDLLDFTATKVGDQVLLEWITLSEINSDYFTIERTTNGIDFRPILTHPGARNSSHKILYQLMDESPMAGNNYYRLRQTDFDGRTETFNIEVVHFDVNSSKFISVYPNPSNGEELMLELKGVEEGDYIIDVLSQDSKLVKRKEFLLLDNESNFKLEVLEGLQLASGTYYLRVIGPSNTQIKLFIVR